MAEAARAPGRLHISVGVFYWWTYDGHGNISGTTDAASQSHALAYGPIVAGRTLPHAVSTFQNFDWGTGTLTTATFTYDRNGNMVTDANRYLAYTAYNLPATMCTANQTADGCLAGNNSRKVDFVYDAEHQRVWQKSVTVSGAGVQASTQTVYLNPASGAGLNYEKECQPDCQGPDGTRDRVRHRHYLSLGGMTVGLHVIDSIAAGTGTQYWHQDHLGSVAAVTQDGAAEPVDPCERAAYEAFGTRVGIKAANADLGNCNYVPGINTPQASPTDRGFTRHEHIEELNLIHMNGRVYDPTLGRFMQADPFIQYPDSTQAYNRYAYLLNNPLNATDPTGYLRFGDVFRAVVAIAAAVVIGPAVSGWYTGQFAATAGWMTAGELATVSTTATVLGGAAGGFSASFIASGGNIEAGLKGGVTGGLFGFAGTIGDADSAGRYLAHAAAGCVSGELSGGGCGNGAASAVVGKAITNLSVKAGWESDGAKFFAATIAGGTASVVGGGKFGNGAYTAAFGYLFNACGNGKCFEFNARNVERYYREGSGRPLTVDISEIVDVLTDPQVTWMQDSKDPDRYSLKTFGVDGLTSTSRSRVLGTVTAMRQSDGSFAVTDHYDFFPHPNPNNDLNIMRRNVITWAASRYVGAGRVFDVIVTGTFRK